MKNYLKIFVMALVFSLSFQSCNSQDNLKDELVYKSSEKTQGIQATEENVNHSVSESRENAITKAVRMAEDAIVGINVTEVREVVTRSPFGDPFFDFFFGKRSRKYKVEGLGSGFLISKDGYILTNHHVAGNAIKIIVTMTDGTKHDAKIIGADRTSDVALLKIEGDNFPYLKFGNSDDVILGEWVIAFGNPFGLFNLNAKPTVTVGVISNNKIDFTQDGRIYRGMIQTDAAISSGNSGGPLLNADGEVIGMNTVIFSTAQSRNGAGSIGIGWAIPINRIKHVIDLLKENKGIDRNYNIGLKVRVLDNDLAHYLGIARRDGVVVIEVDTRTSAGKAGIEPGDIIIKVDGQKITNEDDFWIIVGDKIVGDKLTMTIIRDGKELEKSFVLKHKGLRRGR